jgi:hypothetical protein
VKPIATKAAAAVTGRMNRVHETVTMVDASSSLSKAFSVKEIFGDSPLSSCKRSP